MSLYYYICVLILQLRVLRDGVCELLDALDMWFARYSYYYICVLTLQLRVVRDGEQGADGSSAAQMVLTLLALLVQKYKF